ncbi:MAG: ankyrin repeat domain-containing protein [Candidatus Thiodiazotropha endolucinida]
MNFDKRLINSVKAANASAVKHLVEKTDVDVNYQDKDGMTALHWAAAYKARPCLRILVNCGKCNYLLKDKKDRSASELAFEYGRDYAVGRLLMKKEAQQAVKDGVLEDWSGELVED